MVRNTSEAAPARDTEPCAHPVPLSMLGLDLPEPVEGWAVFLGARGVVIRPDDLGRDSVSRGDARRLLDERRELEVRSRARQQAMEQEMVEQDRRWRESLLPGVPWYEMPPGVLPVVAMTQAAKDALPRRKSLLEEQFDGDYGFHPLPSGQDEA